MDKAKAKLKAEQLMKLALNTPFNEEARTAAMSAVEIISRHGLIIATDEPRVSATTDFLNRAAAAAKAAHEQQQARARAPQPADFFSNWNKQAQTEEDILDDGVWISSKFNGHCAACGEPYYGGDHVLWKRGKGCMCIPCFEERKAVRR